MHKMQIPASVIKRAKKAQKPAPPPNHAQQWAFLTKREREALVIVLGHSATINAEVQMFREGKRTEEHIRAIARELLKGR